MIMKLILNDCKRELKWMKEDSVDSIVTDPPYELGFMGKTWDGSGIAYDIEVWKECLRVLKPGGHLLSFGATRTHHRMMIAIEDAGFEIRDCLMWMYGTGFPKSHNISKAIDKGAGAKREVIGTKGLNSYTTKEQGATYGNMRADFDKVNELTTPTTPEAIQWDGWGTALKPAYEPIVLARKPLSEKTIASNVLIHGTGGLNIDDCRISVNPDVDDMLRTTNRQKRVTDTWETGSGFKNETNALTGVRPEGRFPANVILDEVAGQILDSQSGNRPSQGRATTGGSGNVWTMPKDATKQIGYGDKGGASRFFYIPKTSKKEKNAGLDAFPDSEDKISYSNRVCSTCGKHELQTNLNRRCQCINPTWEMGRLTPTKNTHPTVKPIALMEYLVRLITPPNGIVLDPFMGSGSTGCAAINQGFKFIGIELEEYSYLIAKARIEYYQKLNKGDEQQMKIDGEKTL